MDRALQEIVGSEIPKYARLRLRGKRPTMDQSLQINTGSLRLNIGIKVNPVATKHTVKSGLQ